MKRISSSIMLCMGLIMAVMFLAPTSVSSAHAQQIAHGACTTHDSFKNSQMADDGLITILIKKIRIILDKMRRDLYEAITGSGDFVNMLRAAVTMYICFYGLMFTVGMVDITLYDFTNRAVKLGIIIVLMSSNSWDLFNDTFVKFFDDGTDEWIRAAAAAAVGGSTPPKGEEFRIIDEALSTAVSAKTAVSLMAMFFTPPYGPILTILLALGTGSFVKAILQAAKVYLMSMIVRTLLLGVAPVFIACILFHHTYYLFTGWLNQLINTCIQPILMFCFLSFFLHAVKVSIDNVLTTPVCWTAWGDSLRGSPFTAQYWSFALCEDSECFPYKGRWGFVGAQTGGGNGPTFPVPVLGVLVMVLLADLCLRFVTIVTTIASDISQAGVDMLKMDSPMKNWFKDFQKLAGGGSGSKSSSLSLPNTRAHNSGPESAVGQMKTGAEAKTAMRTNPTPTSKS